MLKFTLSRLFRIRRTHGAHSMCAREPTRVGTWRRGRLRMAYWVIAVLGVTMVAFTGTAAAQTPQLDVFDEKVMEGDEFQFKVLLSTTSSRPVTVQYSTADGVDRWWLAVNAKSGRDFTAASGTLTFAPGETRKTVRVTTTSDSVYEWDERFEMRLSSPTNAWLGASTATGTITDDDPPPTISVSDGSATEGEAIKFKVSLSGPTERQVSIRLKPEVGPGDTAKLLDDFDGREWSLGFSGSPGTASATVPVSTADDDIDEQDETFTLRLLNPTNATLGDATATGTIIDDDDGNPPSAGKLPIVGFVVDPNITEGGWMSFHVKLSEKSDRQVSVQYATSSGTAQSGTDFTATKGLLSFSAGDTWEVVRVRTTGDRVNEGNETFMLTLSSPLNATLGNATATGTITEADTDVDGLPYVAVKESTDAVEGKPVAFTVRLSVASKQTVTVQYETSEVQWGVVRVNGEDSSTGAKGGTDFVATSGTLIFAPQETEKTVSVSTMDDSEHEGSEYLYLKLSNPKNAAFRTLRVGWGDEAVGVRILDNDDPPPAPVVSFASQASRAQEGSGTQDVTVNLSPAPTSAINLNYRSRGTASSGFDYGLLPPTISVPSGATSVNIPVRIIDDSVEDDGETVVLILTAGEGYTVGTSDTHTLTILNHETVVPTVSIARKAGTASSVTEGGKVAFTVTTDQASSSLLTVSLEVSETQGSDFVAAGDEGTQTVTVPADATEATIEVATVADTADEPDGSVTATLAAGSGYRVSTTGGAATVAVQDDDPPVTRPLTVTLAAEHTSIAEAKGETKFTIALSRALGAGETATVPFTVTGGRPNAHWNIRFRGVDNGPGVKRTATGVHSAVTFTEGGRVATLVLIARPNSDRRERTIGIAFGTGERAPSVSGVKGGIAPVGKAVSVAIIDDDKPRGLTVSLAAEHTSIAEAKGETKFTIALSRALGAGETAVVPFTVTGGKPNAHWNIRFRGADNGPGVKRTAAGVHSAVTFTQGGQVATLVLIAQPNDDRRNRTIGIAFGTGERAPSASGVKGGIAPVGEAIAVAIVDDDKPAEPEGRQAPEPVPVLTLSGGGAVTEGGSAGFTLTADPPPASDLAVTLRIAQTGEVASATALGERTVTVPGGRASLAVPVATAGDATDEPDGLLIATVVAVGGARVESGASAMVAVTDDDATAVTLSAPTGDIDEAAGRKTLTVTLGRALVAGETLAVPLTLGGAATPGSDYTVAAPNPTPQGVSYAHLAGTDPATPPTVTFAGPSATLATLLLTANADTADEGASERVTVALGTLRATGLGGGARGAGSASFAIVEPPPEVSIAAKAATITEGGAAAFTVSASRAPGADLAVTLAVLEAADADFVAADDEGAATVTIAKGTTEAEFSVPTVNDSADEPDGAVTVTVAAHREGDARYRVAAAPDDAATVTVTDDDAPAPSLSVDDATVKEGEGLMWFTIRLSAPSEGPVSVSYRTRESTPVSARSNVDYLAGSWDIHFRAGETEKTVWVYIYDDSHDEEAETFEFVLWSASGAPIADAVGVGTIVNDDPMPAAWLARFGRTVAEQALDGIAGRMAAPRAAGMQGTLAGQALSFDPAANDNAAPGHAPGVNGVPGGPGALALADVARSFDNRSDRSGNGGFGNAPGLLSGAGGAGFGNGTQSRTMTARDALLGSSFSLTGATDGSGGSMAFWGRAAQGSFDGREGTFSLDGAVTTGMLGADYARGKWLVGLALAQSEGEGDYRDTGVDPRPDGQTCPADAEGADAELCRNAVRAGDGSVEASLTAAIPYAALQVSERLKLWGAAGYGTGEVTLKTAMGGSYKADTAWSMAAAGLRGDLLALPAPGSGSGAGSGSGPALAVTSDALWTRTSSEKTRDLAASDSDATRLRLGLEGSYSMAFDGGGSFVPKLEFGVRHDGGNAETGFGVEFGGGIAWVDPALGLSLDLSGRTLLAHEDGDLEDRGYSASLAYDPAPATERGLSFTLRQDFGGRATGGLDALFASDPLEERTSGEATSHWVADAAYGFPVFGGRFTGTPHVSLGLATDARDYNLGWRLSPEGRKSLDMSLDFKATRRESDVAAPEHSVGVELNARW